MFRPNKETILMNDQRNSNGDSNSQICNESYDVERVLKAFRGEGLKINNQQAQNNQQD